MLIVVGTANFSTFDAGRTLLGPRPVCPLIATSSTSSALECRVSDQLETPPLSPTGPIPVLLTTNQKDYIGATHFAEVMFVFDNVQAVGYDSTTVPIADEPAEYAALAKGISNAWVNFVAGLDPNGAGLEIAGVAGAWPVYNAAEGGGVGRNVFLDTNGSSVAWDSYRAEGINWMIENSLPVFGN